MTALLLRLEGPMQSWGSRSRFTDRDTERFPTKSGIVGLLCAALGRPRSEPVSDLASLRLVTRVDRSGLLRRDYQTAENVAKASGATPETLPTHRWYLADASFLVAAEGERSLLETLATALRAPRWAISLGRKSYLPSLPVLPPDPAIIELPSLEALRRHHWLADDSTADGWEECDEERGAYRVRDVPVSFELGRRHFTERFVRPIRIDRVKEAA